MRNQELINPNIAPKIDKQTKIKFKLFSPPNREENYSAVDIKRS
jgi:hypothetical protein